MKNKNNILMQWLRGLSCVDYIENYAELKKKAEEPEEETTAEEVEDTEKCYDEEEFETSGHLDDHIGPILGRANFSWRLADEWPIRESDLGQNMQLALGMNARPFMFHVSTWAKVTGRKQRDLFTTFRQTFNPNNFNRCYLGYLMLPEKDCAEFKQWWDAYIKQYGLESINILTTEVDESDVTVFPELPDSISVNGAICTHSGMEYDSNRELWLPSSDMFQEWCWIVENCKGRVWVTRDVFIFDDNADAVMYKLIDKEEKLK